MPSIFEVLLPWSNEDPAQISIEWDKNPYYQQNAAATHGSAYGGHSVGSAPHTPHYHNPHDKRSYSPVPSGHAVSPVPDLSNQAIPVHAGMTHGIIYIGVSGYLE